MSPTEGEGKDSTENLDKRVTEHTHTHTPVHLNTYTHINTSTLTHLYTYTHTHTHTHTHTGLKLGFGEVDYSRNEYSGKVRVVVTKLEENVADLVLTITPKTYEQFNLEGLTLPEDLSADNLPDPAECKHLVACIVPHTHTYTHTHMQSHMHNRPVVLVQQ